MLRSCYVSTSSFQYDNFEHIIATCIENGLKNIELSSGLVYSDKLIEEVYRYRMEFNFLIHNYFPPPSEPFVLNLGAENPEQLKRSIQHCKYAIDVTSSIGGAFYSVHSGFAFHATPEMLGVEGLNYSLFPMEQAIARFKDSLAVLIEYAKSRNVMILIENNVISSGNLIEGKNLLGVGVTADDLLDIINDLNSPFLGLLIDVGHLKVSSRTLDFNRFSFMKKVKKYVKAFHLSDNNGKVDQHLPFNENAWFLPILKDFPEATFILEAHRIDVFQIQKCCELVSNVINSR